ncbi:hypothetical protein A3H85_00335 [Candidatus Daviesbacteria bacterium RIFCSPLOWO2_02_FULL_40_8]|uniref:Uncharacterized protein n=1 Tax=Candidatus Daviesbacteria bacterium RIFCSPLOWO2_01_FULL_40_24 TaxID=1797787 RepID=A0A1F5MJW2_9BACT|nr:MAG: hypothetical protein A2780_00690 [Candidatus Daviesbacteria bacterium RIFCSPHIGHO2_01_FULL_41_45]OGE34354.1 MAG: hypothetical protein A3C32_02055 [Candidatus Daviesbacteria bacterium RIFCSPHIGHO2_02_FULL_41_14]OGE65661.1 MAG: hypothetical protein A3B49_01690 [Candidatus Daviesbacteria bacterium RIFCSPLOWO2_01_FULL_40_24]OGE66059.1 MAG: hypothetical protein A3H85_00335 [Candidatus Daviesbacteria bacterium RIFCSPLOWO2_02_FULL_40_8]
MKYQSYLTELQAKLPAAQNILVVLPSNCGVDCLSSGLSLYLALKNYGKSVSIASESVLKVSESNLYGIGSIQNTLPTNGTGTWVLKIGGVVGSDNKPLFEKVDYNLEGSDLKMKFPIIPGQQFVPTHITPSFEGSNFDLIFTVGAVNLESLGDLYTQHQEAFAKSFVVNIDNSQANSQFGNSKIIDSVAATLSEMVWQILDDLKVSIDQDIASNILAGIYSATSNLQGRVTAETFEVMARALRAGGKQPESQISEVAQPITAPENGFDFTQMYQPSTQADFADPASHTHEREPGTELTYSGNEIEENVTPEEDWLTPKIYSGKSLG